MILVITDSIAKLTDVLVYSNVGTAMQLAADNERKRGTSCVDASHSGYDLQILDLRSTELLQGMNTGETLYIVAHGSPTGVGTVDSQNAITTFGWPRLGRLLSGCIPYGISCIQLLCGYIEYGIGQIASELSQSSHDGVTVIGYRTPDRRASSPTAMKRDDSTIRVGRGWWYHQRKLVQTYAPQRQMDAWMLANPAASVSDTALRAAALTREAHAHGWNGIGTLPLPLFYAPEAQLLNPSLIVS